MAQSELAPGDAAKEDDGIEPYRLHVSAAYSAIGRDVSQSIDLS